MTRSMVEIDDLLKSDKSLYGNPEWVEDGAKAILKSAIVDPRGIVLGGLSLSLWADVSTITQRGGGALVLGNHAIQRISYLPNHSHKNDNAFPTPPELRLRSLPADRSRVYLWKNNRVWPIQPNLRAGLVLDQEPASLTAAFELFLESCAIDAYLPNPPHRPMLEL